MERRASRAAVAVLTAALAPLLVGSVTSPVAAVTPTDQTTRITLAAPDCVGCRVRLVQAKIGRQSWYSHTQRVDSFGEAHFHVPVVRTRGMTMVMTSDDEGWVGANGNVVVRYAGIAKGTQVTEDEAVAQDRGSACWYGTTKPELTVFISNAFVETTDARGDEALMLVSWMSPQHRIAGPMNDLDQGSLRAQDDVVC